MKKKERLASFDAVKLFLNSTSDRERFDVVVRQFENCETTVDTFCDISIAFVLEPHQIDGESYSISIHWGDDCKIHTISFADLPGQCKSWSDLMNFSKQNKELSFHDTWHKSLYIFIIPHEHDQTRLEQIVAYLKS